MDCEKKNIYLFIYSQGWIQIAFAPWTISNKLKQEENEDIGDIHSNSKFRTHLETYIYREQISKIRAQTTNNNNYAWEEKCGELKNVDKSRHENTRTNARVPFKKNDI